MLRWKKLEKREIGIRSQFNFPFEATKSRSGSDCSSWFSCLPCPNQGPVRTALPGFPACPFLVFLLALSESRLSSDCSSWFSCLSCPNQGSVRTAFPDFPACPVRIKVQFGLLFLVFLLVLSESRSSSDCFSWFSCLPCPNQGSVRTAFPDFPACPVRIKVQFGLPFLIFHYPCLNQRSVFILNGLF